MLTCDNGHHICLGCSKVLCLTDTWWSLTASMAIRPATQWHSGNCNGPLARYVKLRVAHAPGMPGTFSPPPRVGDPDMLHGTCVTHVPWCMPGSLTSGFIWSRRRGKRSRHSLRMRNPQFYVSGKRPMATMILYFNKIHMYHDINTFQHLCIWVIPTLFIGFLLGCDDFYQTNVLINFKSLKMFYSIICVQ